ncbi:MAG: YaiI/YqxD family protein [Gammaproteobacteria bacterium]
MEMWVDADACPAVIRDIICRAARRTGVRATFVANQIVNLPTSPQLRALCVESGFDKADARIVSLLQSDDLVITQDIPLAAEVLAAGAAALSPRGEWFSQNDIQARLTLRDAMETLRASGIHSRGPSALGSRERQAFANGLDSWLAKRKQKHS